MDRSQLVPLEAIVGNVKVAVELDAAATSSHEALFDDRGEFRRTIFEHETIPTNHFIVRVSFFELSGLKNGKATVAKINNRWQVRWTAHPAAQF